MGIAYYNMGVQEEFMGSYQRSLEWYQKAYTTIENNPDADPKLKFNFKKAVQQASLKYIYIYIYMQIDSKWRGITHQARKNSSTEGK